jgi:hypothetical protein
MSVVRSKYRQNVPKENSCLTSRNCSRRKEYRTALISLAVTGKIDVRGFVEDRVEGSE